jgi:hypothetical protein
MSNTARLHLAAALLVGFACGGAISVPSDMADASADAHGTLDGGRDTAQDRGSGDALAGWQELELENGGGLCPPQISCSSSWTVTPDGHIAATRRGDAGVAQMSPTELAELDSIVSSAPFRNGMMNGFVCDRPPTDVFVSLRLDGDGASHTQGVTGCVFSGPAGNLPRKVNDLLSKY